MSPRPQQRAPKGRDRDRTDRRAVVDVLLARAQRGALTDAEGALLAEHVRTELRLADETRRAMAGTTQALEQHREAADAAIVEAEQRAETAEKQLAHVEQGDAAAIHLANSAATTWQQRAEQVLAVLARVRNAQTLGDALAAVAEHDGLSPALAHIHARILDRADSTDARLAEQQRDHDIALATVRRAATEAEQRAERTEHENSLLRAVDEGRAYGARRVMDERDQAQQRAEKAEEFAKFAEASAEQAEERLARIHDMADAWERHLPATIRTATAAEAVRNAAKGDDRPVMFGVATTAGAGTIEFAEHERARFERLYTRETVRADQAERRARRYRLAWMAARRDRKADRAAMAAELPLVRAVERVRDLATRMRAGSPQGAAAIYADRIEQALADEHQEQQA